MSLRGSLSKLLASQDTLTADEERRAAAVTGCCTVESVANRTRVKVSGVLRSVVLRPRQAVPTVEAELYDGTGSIDLIWLGRRRIVGIEPGRRGRFEGLVAESRGRRVMYNPRYELLATPGD